jgi:hypothetical protein
VVRLHQPRRPATFFVALDHAQGDTFRRLLTDAVTAAKSR